MTKNPIYQAIVKRKITFFAIFLVIAAGLISYKSLPKQEIPDVSAPAAMITTIYPGASSSEVEQLVATPIEDEIADMDGIDTLESTSKQGLTVVSVEFEVDVDEDKAFDELRRKVDDATKELPDGALDPEVDTELAETPAAILAFTGEAYTPEQLEDYADEVKRKLNVVSGIRKIDLEGEVEKDIIVEVDDKKLAAYGLSLSDFYNSMQAQNVNISSGSIGDGEDEITVKTEGLFESLDDIRQTIMDVSPNDGSVIRVRDVADVYFETKDNNIRFHHKEQQAILLSIYTKEGQNVIQIGDAINDKLKEIQHTIPSDVTMDYVTFQPEDVDATIKDFIKSLMIGVLLVVAVAFLGLGWRSAVVISTAIPLAIFATFSVMKVGGIKMEQISIAGLIIALGMLVDNSVVVNDAIRKRLDDGEHPLKASVNGVKEVGLAMFASLLTVLTAFTPLLAIPGAAGMFLESLPKVVMTSLVASYLIALFIIPALTYVSMRHKANDQKDEKPSMMSRVFLSNYKMISNHKWLAPLIIIGLMAGMIFTSGLLGLSFFPKADKDMIYIDVETTESSDIDLTENVVSDIETIVKPEPEVQSVSAAIGGNLPKIFITVFPGGETPDTAQVKMDVDLTAGDRFETRTELVDYLQVKLDEQLPGIDAVVKEIEQGPPTGAPVQVRVAGDDLVEIKQVAQKITSKLAEVPGSMNVSNTGEDQQYQYYVDVNTNLASKLGFTKYDIQEQVALALNGLTASTYRTDSDEFDLVVESDIDSLEELKTLEIKSNVTGSKVPLHQLATVTLRPQMSVIEKYDRQYVVTVKSYVKNGYSAVEIQDQLKQKEADVDTGHTTLTYAGEKEDINKNFGAAAQFALVAVSIMYLIMFVQFQSFVQPLVIFISIPLAMLGSFIGLFIFGLPLSFTVVLGIISLSGIVINNAIILTDHMNRERQAGKTAREAGESAVKSRVRPILISATTTVFGLLPLAVSDNPMFSPMAVALMFGILLSTVLTLVIIPVLHEWFMSRSKTVTTSQEEEISF